MKYFTGYNEYLIKSDNNLYIRNITGESLSAKMILTNRNLLVFYTLTNDYDDDEALKIYPVEYMGINGGKAQISTGGGNQPFFELYLPDSSLYVFFGHSVRRNWQIQAEGRVQQWVAAINSVVDRYKDGKNSYVAAQTYQQPQNQYYNTNESQTINKRPNFCPGCGSPLTKDDIFCIACGRKV